MSALRLILCGVGGVGRNITRLANERSGLEIVAAYSRNPDLKHRDIGELAGLSPAGVLVGDRTEALAVPADVLLVATTSFVAEVREDILAGVTAGLNVACTAEEMGYPWGSAPAAAVEFEAAAIRNGVTVMGVGANPGYIYEVLALALTGATRRVDQISVRRVVDLSRFSYGVQRRLGLGFDEEDFAAGAAAKTIFGHIGYPFTMETFARRFGVRLGDFTESIKPMQAAEPINFVAVPIAAGESAGFHQRCVGHVDGREWFEAEFLGHVDLASVGLAPEDSFTVEGDPNLSAVIRPGFNPQSTTVAAIGNVLPHIVAAPPGLISMTDLPVPTPW